MSGKSKRGTVRLIGLLALLALGALAMGLRLHGARTLTARQEPVAPAAGRDFGTASLT